MTPKYMILIGLVMASVTVHALVFERDQRADIEAASDPLVKTLAKSVFTFIPKSKLTKLQDGSYEFNDQTTLAKIVNLCSDEPFANSISVGTRCSGFLASSHLGVTAAHCVSPLEIPDFCANYYIIFDYIREGGKDPKQLASTSVHECGSIKKIVYSKDGPSDDYAALEFSKPITDRKPLEFRQKGKIKNGEKIFMLGYPKGMTQKVSQNREVGQNSDPSFFSTNLDCFHGNSGSPVFNARTHIVEGIFVQGEGYVPNRSDDPNLIGDFYLDKSANCNRTQICKKSEGCKGVMDATRTTRIKL